MMMTIPVIKITLFLCLICLAIACTHYVYAQNNSEIQPSVQVFNLYSPEKVFQLKIIIAFFIAFFTILSITLAVNRWIKNNQISKASKNKFWFIILDSNCFPSLALFQFTLWTFVISFSYLGIYLTRILNGGTGLGDLESTILILLGLSVTAPIINKVISNYKYANSGCSGSLPKYSTMLEENGKISLTRFQFFLWTWVSIVIFFGVLGYDIATLSEDKIDDFGLPVINETLLVLMGLSQAGYLGAKSVTKIDPIITRFLKSFNAVKNKEIWTILGNGFGEDSGKVIVNGNEFDEDQVLNWGDKLIELTPNSSLISTLENSNEKPVVLRIISGSREIKARVGIKEEGFVELK
jgi:hypothetical protein